MTESRQEDRSAPDPTRLGRLFGLSGDDLAAVEDSCTDALEARGIDGAAFFARLRQGDPFDEALGLPTAMREVLYARAHRWFAIGRPKRAETLFRALCVIDPEDADTWVGLGVCQRLTDALGPAWLAFDMAARLRPAWAVPPFHAAELSLYRGDVDGAEALIERFRLLSNQETPKAMTAESDRLAEACRLRRTAGRARSDR